MRRESSTEVPDGVASGEVVASGKIEIKEGVWQALDIETRQLLAAARDLIAPIPASTISFVPGFREPREHVGREYEDQTWPSFYFAAWLLGVLDHAGLCSA